MTAAYFIDFEGYLLTARLGQKKAKLPTVSKVSAESRVYNTWVEGLSFEFTCYCLLSTTTTVPRLVSKRIVKYFFHTESLGQ